ncbi:MAG: DUF1992 domain-containing protein [Mycobacteriales bacterium]
MTERRPPGVSTGDWIEAQIRAAQEAGAFDDLPGMGKPIPDLDVPQTDLYYAAKLARREGLDITAMLPPGLALAKEVEELPERLRAVASETRVREAVADLNTRILAAIRAPQIGPPVRTRQLDVEAVVQEWRASLPAPAAVCAPVVAPAPVRRRWLHRR